MRPLDRLSSVARNTLNFARESTRPPVAAAFSLALLSFGLYVMAVMAWLFALMVASWFGYYTEHELRSEQERNLFVRAHRAAFCSREQIPPHYCDEIFIKSAASDYAIRLWVQQEMADDKRRLDAAPLWGLLEPFKLPTSRR
jgi:hypothetical protein